MTEAQKTWIAALRSGKYMQGFMLLRETDEDDTERFCALGVGLAVNNVRWVRDNGHWLAFDSSPAWLLVSVQELLGISEDTQDAVVDWNDKCRLSFSEIADLLEAHLS